MDKRNSTSRWPVREHISRYTLRNAFVNASSDPNEKKNSDKSISRFRFKNRRNGPPMEMDKPTESFHRVNRPV